jgi:O-antigen/teichoic acid export membrane protein
MIIVYSQVGSLMLGYLDSARAVGLYGFANKLPLALVAFADVWVSATYPHAARLFRNHRDELRRQVGRS